MACHTPSFKFFLKTTLDSLSCLLTCRSAGLRGNMVPEADHAELGGAIDAKPAHYRRPAGRSGAGRPDSMTPPAYRQNSREASRAPSAIAAILAHTTCGSTAACPTQLP